MMSRFPWLLPLALFGASLVHPAWAQSPGAAPAQPPAQAPVSAPAEKTVGVDQKALAILKGMSDTLAKSKSLSFTLRRGFEEPAVNGQPLVYMVNSDVFLQRPDRLKVLVTGDGPRSEFYYDGKEIAVYMPAARLVAIETAPSNLEEMLPAAFAKAGIYFPFVDFIVADPYKEIAEGLTSAFVIGKSTVVANTKTDVVAIANANFQAQLWIGEKDRLPRLVYINAAADKGRRSVLEFSNWKLNGAAQTFARPAAAEKAGRMKFEAPAAPTAAKQ
jgi:hypothetical protein